jgi:hypothetical protein
VTGEILWKDQIQHHHWSSPIVANGVLYVPDGTVAENGSSGTATLKAYALRSDKKPEPTATAPLLGRPARGSASAAMLFRFDGRMAPQGRGIRILRQGGEEARLLLRAE